MAVFAVTDTPFGDPTLPVVRRDPAIDAYTLFCYDVLDPYTWPTQAGAAVSDILIDLAENDDATVGSDVLTWNNGLVFGDASTSRILLPTSSDLAADVLKFGITVWVQFADLSRTLESILTHGKSPSGFTNTQYMIYSDLAVLKWVVNADSETSPVTLTTGVVYQLGITIEKSGSDYIGKLWVNGVEVDTVTTTGPMADALTETAARIGSGDIFGAPSYGLKFFRCNANTLAGYTAAQFIAADYAVGLTRF